MMLIVLAVMMFFVCCGDDDLFPVMMILVDNFDFGTGDGDEDFGGRCGCWMVVLLT